LVCWKALGQDRDEDGAYSGFVELPELRQEGGSAVLKPGAGQLGDVEGVGELAAMDEGEQLLEVLGFYLGEPYGGVEHGRSPVRGAGWTLGPWSSE
jgi:hypothetical protein